MTTWYLDPEGGNDANDGTTFANRKKTINSITFSGGDSVRVMASRPAANLGNGTWTDNSGIITLAAAKTLTIDNAESAWSAGSNVTASTIATMRRQGTLQASFALAAGTTVNQLVGYKAVSNLDLSGYTCISLWFALNTTLIANGMFQIALCSDSAGVNKLATLTADGASIYEGVTTGISRAALFQNGGAALPSGVNSIAIYTNATAKPFASGTIYIDNVIATTAVGATDHLSHQCLIGKQTSSEPEWYPIQSIDGTTIVLGGMSDYGTATPTRKYRGTSETTATYAYLGTRGFMTQALATIKNGGTVYSPITWTGGWDRTAMSSQTGQTWFNGVGASSYGINNASGFNYHTYPDATIGFSGFATAALNFNSQSGILARFIGFVNCASVATVNGTRYTFQFEADYVAWGDGATCCNVLTSTNVPLAGSRVRIRRITGATTYACGTPASNWSDRTSDIVIGQIDNSPYGFNVGSTGGRARIRGTTFKNIGSYAVNAASAGSGSDLMLDRPMFPDGASPINTAPVDGFVRMNAVNGNRADNRIYNGVVNQIADTGTVHGTSAQSVKLTVAATEYLNTFPHRTPLAKLALSAGYTVTFKCWVQRSDSTNLRAGIGVIGGQVLGINDSSTGCVTGDNTWEQLSVSVTPTEDGVAEFYGYVGTGATAGLGKSVYFGDSSVVQA